MNKKLKWRLVWGGHMLISAVGGAAGALAFAESSGWIAGIMLVCVGGQAFIFGMSLKYYLEED